MYINNNNAPTNTKINLKYESTINNIIMYMYGPCILPITFYITSI